MQHYLFWVVFVAYFSFFNTCDTKPPQPENGIPYILSQLFKDRNKPPIILYLEPKPNDRFDQDDFRQGDRSIEEIENLRQNQRSVDDNQEHSRYVQYDNERDENDEDFSQTQNDERAYVLYHLLRTTIEEEEVDPDIVQRLQPAKEFLRKAFIGRCRNLNRCLRQCPKPKIKYTCTVQCKQIYDDLDECDQPKEDKCGESKCGNTMPPSWLL